MEIEQLKKLLEIDKANLDQEVSRQPFLFFQVAEACVEAAAERDACKEELTTVDAQLDGEVRAALARAEKVTEAMVKNSVQMHKRHQEAFDVYQKAKTKADLLAALKESFHQRHYMLRELSNLFVSSYYEQTSIGSNNLDKAKYEARRNQLAAGRRERIKERTLD